MEFRSLRRSEWKTGMIRRGKAVDARLIERSAVCLKGIQPECNLDLRLDERTVLRFGREINGGDWRFEARRLETGIRNRRFSRVSRSEKRSERVGGGIRQGGVVNGEPTVETTYHLLTGCDSRS